MTILSPNAEDSPRSGRIRRGNRKAASCAGGSERQLRKSRKETYTSERSAIRGLIKGQALAYRLRSAGIKAEGDSVGKA